MPKGRPRKTKPVDYKLTLRSLGRVYKTEGKTLLEALNKFKIIGNAKAVCVLTVDKGGVVKDRLINGMHALRAFGGGSPTTKMIFIKKIAERIE